MSTRTTTLGLALLLLVLAGCRTAPEGYEKMKAVVKPAGRPVAFVPFVAGRGGAQPIDGIKLAELSAIALRRAIPGLTVYGPSAMRDALAGGMNEARWSTIARSVGAKLIVLGEITFLQTNYEELVQSRDGIIGISMTVLDVTDESPRKIGFVADNRFDFPEEIGDKFEPRYAGMNETVFRGELLKHGAEHVASFFYDHLERKPLKSRLLAEYRAGR